MHELNWKKDKSLSPTKVRGVEPNSATLSLKALQEKSKKINNMIGKDFTLGAEGGSPQLATGGNKNSFNEIIKLKNLAANRSDVKANRNAGSGGQKKSPIGEQMFIGTNDADSIQRKANDDKATNDSSNFNYDDESADSIELDAKLIQANPKVPKKKPQNESEDLSTQFFFKPNSQIGKPKNFKHDAFVSQDKLKIPSSKKIQPAPQEPLTVKGTLAKIQSKKFKEDSPSSESDYERNPTTLPKPPKP